MAEHVPAQVSTGPRSRAASAASALRTCGAGLRWFAGTPGPGLLVVAVALAACTSSSAPPQPQTARVERTTVYTAVSSSGALSASSEQNLGFLKGGRLTAVNVKVGDRVTAGQVLANLDDGPARRTLEQQQAQLDAQRAVLDRLVNSTTVTGAENSVEQAQAILDATEDQVDATVDADESALDRAQRQLGFDEDARDDANDQLDADEKACETTPGSGTATTGTFTFPFTPVSPLAAASAPGTTGTTGTTGGTDTGAGAAHKRTSSSTDSTAGTPAPTGTGTATSPGTFSATTTPIGGACSAVSSDQSAVTAADRQVEASRTARDAARQKRDVDAAAGQVSIENARQGVVNAQNNLDSAATDRPSTIAQQQALVAAQDAVVRQAQQDVDETVLRAPVDGTVAALNGAVGEYVAASSGTSALAPGSSAAIPGTGASAAAEGSEVARPGGTQFLVLDGVETFQVVVPFAEADASRISSGQNVDVTFDAVPDLTRRGTVLRVGPAASASSGVISYYVTVLLNETDPRLRNGQTALAAIRTEELRDVLAVPNSAVRRSGGQTTVMVVGPGGVRRTVPFQAGEVGDTMTQVVSGLSEGDQVVVTDQR
ncbi:HlyD family efflux transporter periplasmic adaptor subunit [Pseudonocardia charpentierae]|uniref:HlyD family efflux transporter periplasmic adaptor subunit n=1 Tax=Pseudonocardia charpentierae TaxID=3075545 RepID=A0ABU2N7Y0_9PSEU|nr:HlyD family efflux transporter periplasmic adaptor subunit [Pseudonocardia sp. DSM 45834]MDT0349603.1 HlyD family efflux transporter periplasmic adaptor subunit [Pseudonocardia sp. DSM 45834]